MASKKVFLNEKEGRELSITRMGLKAMLFEITDPKQKINLKILLNQTDLNDLQRDIYAYLNFSKNV